MTKCKRCQELQTQLDAAHGILTHNMGVANRNARALQRERDKIIRNLRKRFSAIEIAAQVGLTRQRVHQILNEQQPSEAPKHG